jgi:hypothetical protein
MPEEQGKIRLGHYEKRARRRRTSTRFSREPSMADGRRWKIFAMKSMKRNTHFGKHSERGSIWRNGHGIWTREPLAKKRHEKPGENVT